MPEKKPVDLSRDLGLANGSLLEDVAEAAKQVKERKARDKALDAKLVVETRDRTMMWVMAALGAVLVFVLAYWIVFARGSAPPPPVQPRPVQTVQPQPPIYRPQYAPPRPTPISEPVRRNPSETYDEGPDTGGM